MRPISKKVRKEIDTDLFYRKCCITGEWGPTMQHCWIYSQKQIGEAWAIVGLAARYNTSHPPTEIKEKCEIVSLVRATPADLAKYPRMNWEQKKKYLFGKYPEFYQIKLKEYGGNEAVLEVQGKKAFV